MLPNSDYAGLSKAAELCSTTIGKATSMLVRLFLRRPGMCCTVDRLLDSGLEMKTCAAAAAAVKLIADWISPSSDDGTRSDWALVGPMLLSCHQQQPVKYEQQWNEEQHVASIPFFLLAF